MKKNTTLILLQTVFYFCFLATLFSPLVSCNSIKNKTKINSTKEVAQVRQWISSQWPKNTKTFKTTNSGIYLTNLNSSIDVLTRLYKKSNKTIIGECI